MGSKHDSDIRGSVPLYIYPMLAYKGMEYARLSHTQQLSNVSTIVLTRFEFVLQIG